MRDDPPISVPARMLGFAGLLPQLLALLLTATGIDPAMGALIALAYAVLIVSFLGGIWWGFAMRTRARQPQMAFLAVAPTLTAFALVLARLMGFASDLTLVAIAIVLMLTLLIDRMFVEDAIAPPGWMGLRVPLSVGLALLTLATAAVAPDHIAITYSN
jgi:hypothetical protein